MNPDYWDDALEETTVRTTSSTMQATTETTPEAATTRPQTAPMLSPLMIYAQMGVNGKCDSSCQDGCPASCDANCIGCDFCKPASQGPFGETAKYCRPEMQAYTDASQTKLLWLAPSSSGEEQIQSPMAGIMKVDVKCQNTCYEVWFSTVPDFSSFQTEIVYGNTSALLPMVPTDAGYAKVRAIQKAEVASYPSRSVWSNVVAWQPGSQGAMIYTDSSGQIRRTTTTTPSISTTRTTVTVTLTSTTHSTISPEIPTTMMPLWELPQAALPRGVNESGDGADGIEAALQFQVNPGAVDGYASLSGTEALKGALAATLQLDLSKVTVLSLKAASTVPGKGGNRRLQGTNVVAAPAGGAITGVLQTNFIVLCDSPDERHAAAQKVEGLAWDTGAQQRFAAALRAGPFDKLAMQASMVDRQWSRAAATGGQQGDGMVVVSHSAGGAPDSVVAGVDFIGMGLPTLSLIAAAAVLLIALVVCVACNADQRHSFGRRREDDGAKEAQPFLGGSFAEDSDGGEMEKGDVPTGVAGFNPRTFQAQKYMTHSPEKHHKKSHEPVKAGSGYDLLVGSHPHLSSHHRNLRDHFHRGV